MPPSDSAARSSEAALTSAMTTRAPASASHAAASRPRPPAPPVNRATWPSRPSRPLGISFLSCEGTRNDFLHDFVRPAVDLLHAGVGVHAGDGVLLHVAVSAEQLDALVEYLALHVGQPPLGHGGGGVVEPSLRVRRDA